MLSAAATGDSAWTHPSSWLDPGYRLADGCQDWSRIRDSLTAVDLHVWVFQSAHSDVMSDWSVLGTGERGRAERLAQAEDRVRFVRGRAMVRRILAAYEGIEARTITFTAGEYGKPALSAAGAVQCSWSHAGSVWLLAVARSGAVGIDVERVDADFAWRGPAEIAFHPHERQFVERSVDGCNGRFYAVWTRKEALLKGLGTGLHDDMAALSIVNTSGVMCDAVLTPGGTRWQVIGLDMPPGFAGAVTAGFTVTRITAFAPVGADLSHPLQRSHAVAEPVSSIAAERPWIK
ncbi:4'-phosphopantetheinyl transferase superfamily protein [Reyranella sp. CPCC 100927]|nr:4'-phosphopantetheinyl transferase superfamily protein [Reyranella sp. CPCC 100927]